MKPPSKSTAEALDRLTNVVISFTCIWVRCSRAMADEEKAAIMNEFKTAAIETDS